MSAQKKRPQPDSAYRCERCWREDDLNLYPKSDFLGKEAEGFVILCKGCREFAPKGKDKELFEGLFLQFASSKELILHYKAANEKEAKELWSQNKSSSLEPENGEEVVIEKNVDETVTSLNNAPFGYENVNGIFSIIDYQGEIIKEIFGSYLAGKTMERIARELSKKKKSEIPLNAKDVREILKNPFYAGYVFLGNNAVLGDHKGIIDKETFNKVQEKIVRNIRNPKYVYKPLVLGQ